jgi:release factor glutamine methyltransferase
VFEGPFAQVRDALNALTLHFQASKMTDPRRQAEDLLGDLLDYSRSQLYQCALQALDAKKQLKLKEWMERRLQGEPLAYIAGKVHFYGCLLEINSNVLIPRPETELLVDQVVNTLKNEEFQEKELWDICCGSGCIGIALKKAFPDLTVFLSDCSPEAVALASRNAAANNVTVNCLCGDLLAPFRGRKAHYVISNPPYISEVEYLTLDREVKTFEPRMALVAGQSGLEIYTRFAHELPSFLYPHAKVWLEIGYRQGDAIQELFRSLPWTNQRVKNDWAGHHRFFFLENE